MISAQMRATVHSLCIALLVVAGVADDDSEGQKTKEAMSSVWQRPMAIHVAIDTYHFHDPYLLYRQFILIHFELAKSGDTLRL
ncbi:hypothetical protein Y032_0361g3464 [Ancylostoma ceylanicum]|uniref:Secreted protein n=1 Tax=Ancylostoma ceylanicum TaxID=53326 RepID=A0A016RVJ0_9BILA|nr:hypothetical protein Y032_0361g3464 [Ancylostoma ceylanicum]